MIIMHELVHVVDCTSLSTSLEWNELVEPNMQRFRGKYKTFAGPFVGTVYPRARGFMLPSFYAASDPTEALAECTTAMVIANWEPPSGVKSFIQRNILSKPEAIDRERQLVSELERNIERLDFHKSVGLSTQILRFNSNSVNAWIDLSSVWDNLDEPELAEFCARKGLQILEHNRVPSHDPLRRFCYAEPAIAYSNYSDHFRESGQYKQAIGYTTKAIELDPSCAIAYGNRGLAYACMKQYRKSIKDYNKAIGLAPKEKWTYLVRGNAYEELGDHEKAIYDYNEAIKLAPHFMQAYNRRSAIYKKLGNRRK